MTSLDAIIAHAVWDAEPSVWVATPDDFDGLAVEAATLDALGPEVQAALSDFIELSGPSPHCGRFLSGFSPSKSS